jgi:TetR/AcrR family hemagglutinin/protease transcriptional regulator
LKYNDNSGAKRLRPNERREQLLLCALSAFAENGVARATHSHVAKRAGVVTPTVHSYFRSREDLQSAVLGEVESYLIELVTESLSGEKTVSDALTTLATRFAKEAATKSDTIKVWLDWSTGVRDDVWPRYLTLLDNLHLLVQPVFQRGKRECVLDESFNVKAATRLFIGVGHTLALMQFANVSEQDTTIFMDQFIQSLMNSRSEK